MRYSHLISIICVTVLTVSCSEDEFNPVPVGFGEERVFEFYREVDVGWTSSDGAILSGTLFLPKESGLYTAAVWHFGSNRWERSPFRNSGMRWWLQNGIAVLTYDKRGVGKSEGKCCPWTETDYFPLLGDDVLSGARFIASHPEIDSDKVGAYGFSQAGWVLPVSASKSDGDLAFTVIGSGPTVTLGEELLYSKLTGENDCKPTGLSEEEINRQLDEEGPSRFDPLPYLKSMENSGLWIYGEKDLSVPVKRSIAILDTLVAQE